MRKIYFLIGLTIISCSFQKEKEKNFLISSDTVVIQGDIVSNKKSESLINVYSKVEDLEYARKTIDTLPPKKITRTIKEYKESINHFLKKKTVHDLINTDDIESVTPTSQKEFSQFYSLTYPDEKKQRLFDEINLAILEHAMEDKGDVLFLYSNVAEFVDGEYAEGYYVDLESIVGNNKEKFCFIYKYLSKRSKWLLEPLYKEICKGIKRAAEDY